MKALKVLLIFFDNQKEADDKKDKAAFLSNLPEIKLITDYDFEFVSYKKEKEGWQKLARLIHKNFDKYNGFVVYCRASNVLFASNITSFIFQNLARPIVFTGSKGERLADPAADAKSNLINSFQLAVSDLAEVCLMFGNRILRPSQAFYNPQSDLNLFDAHPAGLIGKIDFGISFFDRRTRPKKSQVEYAPELNDRVNLIDVFPFTDLAMLKSLKGDGLVLRGGRLDREAVQMIHCLLGRVVLYKNEGDDNCGSCISIINGTLETVLAKLMWCLGQTRELKSFRQLYLRNLTGEWGKV